MEKVPECTGIDENEIEEVFRSSSDGQPDMMKSMQMTIVKDYVSDPENLEKSRQMILQNPIMTGMMTNLPSFEEIINDKEMWRDGIFAAVSMYKNVGNDMMNVITGKYFIR